jgi:hypothetical protein
MVEKKPPNPSIHPFGSKIHLNARWIFWLKKSISDQNPFKSMMDFFGLFYDTSAKTHLNPRWILQNPLIHVKLATHFAGPFKNRVFE